MRSNRGARFADHLNPLKIANELYDTYDFASFTVATATTDYDVKANQSALFKNAPRASGMIIWHDQTVTIKFNSTDMPGITHDVAYEPHNWFDKIEITNIYITNASGSTATIRIFLI